MRPAFLSLALLGALALASRAQDDDGAAPDKPVAPANDSDAEGPKAADAAEPRDFSGKYLADGKSNTGKPYRAMVEITREGDVYQVIWVLGPRESYMGVGIVEGSALCVGFAVGQVPGVVIYQPDAKEQGKKLVGRWTAPGAKGKTFTETLTPLP
jgi:hypothetical protein